MSCTYVIYATIHVTKLGATTGGLKLNYVCSYVKIYLEYIISRVWWDLYTVVVLIIYRSVFSEIQISLPNFKFANKQFYLIQTIVCLGQSSEQTNG